MPRNFDRRVEIAFPVLEGALQAEIREILEIQLADSVKGGVSSSPMAAVGGG